MQKTHVEPDAKTSIAYESLPNVLIQEPQTGRVFHIEAESLELFSASSDSWALIGQNTVTFVIPDEETLDAVPPFSQTATSTPDVLIQWPRGERSYFVPWAELEAFEIDPATAATCGWGISFSVPRGTELIQELPALRAAILQTGTSGFQ